MKMNQTEREINELAHVITKTMGWVVPDDLIFIESENPRAMMILEIAIAVYKHMKAKAVKP